MGYGKGEKGDEWHNSPRAFHERWMDEWMGGGGGDVPGIAYIAE